MSRLMSSGRRGGYKRNAATPCRRVVVNMLHRTQRNQGFQVWLFCTAALHEMHALEFQLCITGVAGTIQERCGPRETRYQIIENNEKF
jgi:hypothetical protein